MLHWPDWVLLKGVTACTRFLSNGNEGQVLPWWRVIMSLATSAVFGQPNNIACCPAVHAVTFTGVIVQ